MNTQPILVQKIGKESGDRWVLVGTWDGKTLRDTDWVYSFHLRGKSYKLTIPRGFDALDGASVPRFAQGLVKMGGRDMPDEAWLPHDFLYHCKGRVPSGSLKVLLDGRRVNVKQVTKKFADRVLHNELKNKAHGLASFKPFLAYIGVRAAFWKRF